jgi:hypothetical protein
MLVEALEQDDVAKELSMQKEKARDDLSSADLLGKLDALIGKPFFNKYNHTASFKTVDFSKAFGVMEATAPTWTGLLKKMMSNRRQEWGSYPNCKGSSSTQQQRTYFITSILCRCRARDSANFFAKVMGVYLFGSGVKRCIIELFDSIGVCDGYKYIYRIMQDIAGDTKGSIQSHILYLFMIY